MSLKTNFRALLLTWLAVLFGACTNITRPLDCPHGRIEVDGACREQCDTFCNPGFVCTAAKVCIPCSASASGCADALAEDCESDDCVSTPVCGDGFLSDEEEECDDGNLIGGDGCSAECREELCGDGDITGVEECDDGNTIDGDGCDADCNDECGNGAVDGDEECDDGNNNELDACSRNCRVLHCFWQRKHIDSDGDGETDETIERMFDGTGRFIGHQNDDGEVSQTVTWDEVEGDGGETLHEGTYEIQGFDGPPRTFVYNEDGRLVQISGVYGTLLGATHLYADYTYDDQGRPDAYIHTTFDLFTGNLLTDHQLFEIVYDESTGFPEVAGYDVTYDSGQPDTATTELYGSYNGSYTWIPNGGGFIVARSYIGVTIPDPPIGNSFDCYYDEQSILTGCYIFSEDPSLLREISFSADGIIEEIRVVWTAAPTGEITVATVNYERGCQEETPLIPALPPSYYAPQFMEFGTPVPNPWIPSWEIITQLIEAYPSL